MSLILIVFAAVYLGMALGRWPGLRIDRTGIALLGAIVLYVSGRISGGEALAAIDFPTLFILFGLMILSAQFAASGFYDWCAAGIAGYGRPLPLLALVVSVAGLLSAVLANDVVVFAMTPLLCRGLLARGLDPRPYLIALAGAANAGSAATMIGNPQNILIAQLGRLDFWHFVGICGVPAVLALICVFMVVWLVWQRRWWLAPASANAQVVPRLRRWQLGKGMLAALVLLILFATPLSHVSGVLAVAGALLVSRGLSSRDMLGMVDWHLLVLFAALFVVTKALASTGLPAQTVAALAHAGWTVDRPELLAPLTLLGSNTIGNVPAVMLLLAIWPRLEPHTLYALAIFSTLAGNLLLLGSMANLIVVERAREAGVRLGFADHARCGIPITLLSCGLAAVWLYGIG